MHRLPSPTPSQEDAEATLHLALPRGMGAKNAHPIVIPPQRGQRVWRHLPFALILLLATYLITINVATPWQSIHEDNGTLNESIAINHLRYGLGVTKGQDLLDLEAKQSFGPQDVSEAKHFAYFLDGPVHPQVYGDHPPLLGLTIAGAFVILGPHFWSERLVPIAYALAGLLLFYLLMCHCFDRGIARCAAFLYATFPMMAYFGRDVSHEAPTLFWALALLNAYLRWRADGRDRWRWLMASAVVIGGLYGWPLYYFATILLGVDWVTRRQLDRALALVTVVPALITFVLVMAQLDWALGGNLTSLGTMLLHRTGGGSEDVTAAITTIGWFNQVATWNAEGFGSWSQLALPFIGFFLARRYASEGWSARMVMIVIAALWGVSHMVIFRNGAFVHAYWQFYLLPFYAAALAWAAVSVARQQITAPVARGLALGISGGVVMCLGLPTIFALYSTGFHTTLPVTPLFDLWH